MSAHLAALGLDMIGFDLTPAMLALAGEAHPALRLVPGSLTALPLADGSLAGALVYYSLIHIPPEHRAALAELARVVAPGGHVLLGFQVGTYIVDVSAPDARPQGAAGSRRSSPEVRARAAAAATGPGPGRRTPRSVARRGRTTTIHRWRVTEQGRTDHPKRSLRRLCARLHRG